MRMLNVNKVLPNIDPAKANEASSFAEVVGWNHALNKNSFDHIQQIYQCFSNFFGTTMLFTGV